MNEEDLEPVRAAWNGAYRPRRTEGPRIYDSSGRLIGAMNNLIDAELVVMAVNIMPLVFADAERLEVAAPGDTAPRCLTEYELAELRKLLEPEKGTR